MLDKVQVPSLGIKTSNERRVSIFGMVESGKTTVLCALETTCIDLTNRKDDLGKNFYYFVEERTSGIRQASSEFRKGMFPERTPEGHTFEADFLMRWEDRFNKIFLRLPFCETAGEEIAKLISRFQSGQYDLTPDTFANAGQIYDYILNCSGAIIIAPVTRALGVEEERGGRIKDPDVNIARLLECIYKYRETNGLPPLKGLGVLLTKYDALSKYLCEQGMNLDTPEGTHKFMATHFKETYAVLKWYGLEKVRFWPTWVELETEKDLVTGNLVAIRHPVRGYKIRTDMNTRMPKFSVSVYRDVIGWLKETFKS